MTISGGAYHSFDSLHTRDKRDLVTEIPRMPIFERLSGSILRIDSKHTLQSIYFGDKRMTTGLAFLIFSGVHSSLNDALTDVNITDLS